MIYISSSNRKSSSAELRTLLQFCIRSSKYVILTSYESKDEDFAESMKACGLAKHERRTDGSLVTAPSVCDLCWFDIHAVDLRVMEKDFYSVVQVGGYEFEDISFADAEGRIWFRSCSHERFWDMELTEDQYERFCRTGMINV